MSRSMQITTIAVALLVGVVAGSAAARVKLETGRRARVSEDGLHLAAHTGMTAAAYVTPDLDLSRYHKLFVRPSGVSFRTVEDPSLGVLSVGEQTLFPVSDDMKVHVRSTFRASFDDALAKIKGYEVTPFVGADALAVQAFLVDVVAHFPTDHDERWSSSTFSRTWEATIVLELRDSTTEKILARTVEREAVRPQDSIHIVAMGQHTDQLLERWALLLSNHITELTKLAGE